MTAAEKAPVTLYSRLWCGYCHAARRLLTSLGIDFEEVPLGEQPELHREVSEKAGGWPTVPMIFIGDRFVGGYTEVADLHRRGELVPMIESASFEFCRRATIRRV